MMCPNRRLKILANSLFFHFVIFKLIRHVLRDRHTRMIRATETNYDKKFPCIGVCLSFDIAASIFRYGFLVHGVQSLGSLVLGMERYTFTSVKQRSGDCIFNFRCPSFKNDHLLCWSTIARQCVSAHQSCMNHFLRIISCGFVMNMKNPYQGSALYIVKSNHESSPLLKRFRLCFLESHTEKFV